MSPVRMAKVEEATRVVLAFVKAFNRHDLDGVMALMSENSVFENSQPAPDGTVYHGKDVIRCWWQEFFDQSPQSQIEIEEIFGFQERGVLRWKCKWDDNLGEKRQLRGIGLFRVREGFIVEMMSYVKG